MCNAHKHIHVLFAWTLTCLDSPKGFFCSGWNYTKFDSNHLTSSHYSFIYVCVGAVHLCRSEDTVQETVSSLLPSRGSQVFRLDSKAPSFARLDRFLKEMTNFPETKEAVFIWIFLSKPLPDGLRRNEEFSGTWWSLSSSGRLCFSKLKGVEENS